MRASKVLVTVSLIMLAIGFLVVTLLWDDHYLLLSFGLITVSMLFFLFRFEKEKSNRGNWFCLPFLRPLQRSAGFRLLVFLVSSQQPL